MRNGHFSYLVLAFLVFLVAVGVISTFAIWAGIDIDFREPLQKIRKQIPIDHRGQTTCTQDTDCEIKYNVSWKEEKCLAGCFPQGVKVDGSCDLMWEAFPEGTTCKCENQECKLIEP